MKGLIRNDLYAMENNILVSFLVAMVLGGCRSWSEATAT